MTRNHMTGSLNSLSWWSFIQEDSQQKKAERQVESMDGNWRRRNLTRENISSLRNFGTIKSLSSKKVKVEHKRKLKYSSYKRNIPSARRLKSCRLKWHLIRSNDEWTQTKIKQNEMEKKKSNINERLWKILKQIIKNNACFKQYEREPFQKYEFVDFERYT